MIRYCPECMVVLGGDQFKDGDMCPNCRMPLYTPDVQSRSFVSKEDLQNFVDHIDAETKEKFKSLDDAHKKTAALARNRSI